LLAIQSAKRLACSVFLLVFMMLVAYPGVASKLEGIPDNYEKLLAKNDINWAAKNRERILAEWSKRYEGKAEPK
jgi:iron(III) transport system substrate-binding protein